MGETGGLFFQVIVFIEFLLRLWPARGGGPGRSAEAPAGLRQILPGACLCLSSGL